MITSLLEYDRIVFDWINQGLSNGFFDAVLPIVRNKKTWILLYIFLIGYSIYIYKIKSIVIIGFALLCVFLTDTISSQWIKKSIERPRPCHVVKEYPQTNVLVHCGSGYSFTSSHATNHFGIAFFFLGIPIFKRRGWKWFFVTWAASIAFSQVYVGVHYPIDVTCGAFLGSVIGFLLGKLAMEILYIFPNKKIA